MIVYTGCEVRGSSAFVPAEGRKAVYLEGCFEVLFFISVSYLSTTLVSVVSMNTESGNCI